MAFPSVQEDLNDTLSENMTKHLGAPASHGSGYSYYDYYDYYYDCMEQHTTIHPLLYPHSIATNILAFIGIVANITGICSLIRQRKNQSECNRSRVLFLISLSVSDIATCLCVSLKSYVTYALGVNEVECESPLTFYCTQTFLDLMIPACQMISLLNLLGMAIDHFITFKQPFRYLEIMGRRRTVYMITGFWIGSLFIALCEYISGLKFLRHENYDTSQYCKHVNMDMSYHPEYPLLLIAPICLIAMMIIYVSISSEIKKLVVSAPPRQQDFGQAKRALYTTYVILLTFLVCWLPCFGMTTVLSIGGILFRNGHIKQFVYHEIATFKTILLVQQWLFALLLVNSIVDPIIYMSYFRTRLTSLCDAMVNKVSHQRYSLIDPAERRVEVGPSHTMTTMRSSIQFSAGGNATALEPLASTPSTG